MDRDLFYITLLRTPYLILCVFRDLLEYVVQSDIRAKLAVRLVIERESELCRENKVAVHHKLCTYTSARYYTDQQILQAITKGGN